MIACRFDLPEKQAFGCCKNMREYGVQAIVVLARFAQCAGSSGVRQLFVPFQGVNPCQKTIGRQANVHAEAAV